MVHLAKWNSKSVTLSIKPNCITVSFESVEVYSFDLTGRLWTALINDISYRRGLDGKIIAKWLNPDNSRSRKWLTPDESRAILKRASISMVDLLSALEKKQTQFSPELANQDLKYIQRASCFNEAKSQQDITRYASVYQPVGILPPDQYMAVVLQVTEGCSFNTCTFCDFYRDRPFRIKRPEQLRSHIHAIKDYLGDGLSLRRTIFLGDANALVTPMKILIPNLEVANQELDVKQLGGIYAFLDGFNGEKKTVSDYTQLKQMGLERIYIGMESGSPELLKFLNKPGSPEDVIHAVNAIKEGGVAVGIIILLGAGGRKFAHDHVNQTIKAINQMPLDLDDIIYFSELIENEGLPYVQNAYANELQPLSSTERIQQGELIEKALLFSDSRGTPHISRYDIREFVY